MRDDYLEDGLRKKRMNGSDDDWNARRGRGRDGESKRREGLRGDGSSGEMEEEVQGHNCPNKLADRRFEVWLRKRVGLCLASTISFLGLSF